MRHCRPLILLGALVLLACVWLLSTRSSSQRGDLSVEFRGLTNDPGASVFRRLSVVGDGRGLYALFAVTNISQKGYVQFGISGVERQSNDTWTAHESEVFKPALGFTWSPGFGAFYAIPWPPGLTTDRPWRLRLWVMREPKPILRLVNQRLGRELFRPYWRHTVTSSVVTPTRLHESGPGEPGGYPQDGPANGSQPIRSEANGTSSAADSRR